jgi:hypothetical protein
MPAKSEPPRASKEEQQQYDTSHRGDTAGSGGPAGATGARDKGVVVGIGGTGGSSGAGATRHVADEIGELSGIEDTGTQPEAISGTVPDYKRSPADGGNPGKTRGPAPETMPNPDDEPAPEGNPPGGQGSRRSSS